MASLQQAAVLERDADGALAAEQAFIDRIGQVAGVLGVEDDPDAEPGPRAFVVTVMRGRKDARYAVYDIEADVCRVFPETDFRVRVAESLPPA